MSCHRYGKSNPDGSRSDNPKIFIDKPEKEIMRKTHDEIMIEKFEKEYPQLSQSFKKIQEEQYRLFASKMSDYGLDNIALGTKLETKDEKKMSLSGIFFRMNDKINRWKTFLTKGEVQNESLTDTYKDLSNYGLIALLVEKDQWKK